MKTDSFLYWRYTFTFEYKKSKYSRKYNNLKKKYTWDSNYWRNPKYIVEWIIKTLFGMIFVYSLVPVLYLVTTGGGLDGFEVTNLLLIIPMLVCICIMAFWNVTGSKAIKTYGTEEVKREVIIKEEYKPKTYSEEEKKDYTKFWENVE